MNKDFTIENKVILLVARRGSGKSILTKHLLSYYSKSFHKVYIASGTEEVTNYYLKTGIVPESSIFNDYSEAWGQSLIDGLKRENSGIEEHKKKKVLLVLDDLVSTNNLCASKTLNFIVTCGRHLGLSLIITSQYIHLVSTIIRENSDFIMCGQQSVESIKLLSAKYRNCQLSAKEFINYYDDSTENYNFFVINCNSVKNKKNINELYGKIRAPKETYKIVQEVIEKKKIVMKDDDSWGALFSDKKIRTTEIEKITIEKKVLVVVKPYIQNVV